MVLHYTYRIPTYAHNIVESSTFEYMYFYPKNSPKSDKKVGNTPIDLHNVHCFVQKPGLTTGTSISHVKPGQFGTQFDSSHL